MSILHLASGAAIYYRLLAGDQDRPWLVFLHEGLGCSGMWQDFPERLCRLTGCPGLVYDRQGYGRSSALQRPRTIHYLHDYALRELPEVLEKTIADKPFVLIGHSDGGSISLILGAEKPAFLKAIITEAAHVFVEAETLRGIDAAVVSYVRGDFAGLEKYHGEKTAAVFNSWADTWRSPWFKFWNIEYLLSAISCPLLAIQGHDDQYGTSRQVETIVAKVSGQATPAFIDACGHNPHREQPAAVAELMAAFIGRLP